MVSPLKPCEDQRYQGSLKISLVPGWVPRVPGVLDTGCVWSSQVNRQVCELDVLGPDCDERRKACLEIYSSLRRRLCLQV